MGIVGGGASGPVSEDNDVAEEGRQDRVDVNDGRGCCPGGY